MSVSENEIILSCVSECSIETTL